MQPTTAPSASLLNERIIRNFAVFQLTLGLGGFVVGIVATVIFPVLLGRGLFLVWPELFFITSGSLGLSAVKRRTVAAVNTHMGFCIASIIAACILIGEGSIWTRAAFGTGYYTMFLFVTLDGATQIVIALTSSILCCRAAGCCSSVSQEPVTQQQAAVGYVNGQTVMTAQGPIMVSTNQMPQNVVYVSEGAPGHVPPMNNLPVHGWQAPPPHYTASPGGEGGGQHIDYPPQKY